MADTKTIVIQGVEFQAPVPYAAGHVLTEHEARHLNQTYHENVRNNFAKTVKAAQNGDGSVDELPAKFDEYISTYTLDSARAVGTGTRSLDPIEREARALAKALIRDKLAATGRSINPPKDASDDEKAEFKAKIDAKIEEVAAREEIMAAARKNVADRQKQMSKIAEGLDL